MSAGISERGLEGPFCRALAGQACDAAGAALRGPSPTREP